MTLRPLLSPGNRNKLNLWPFVISALLIPPNRSTYTADLDLCAQHCLEYPKPIFWIWIWTTRKIGEIRFYERKRSIQFLLQLFLLSPNTWNRNLAPGDLLSGTFLLQKRAFCFIANANHIWFRPQIYVGYIYESGSFSYTSYWSHL